MQQCSISSLCRCYLLDGISKGAWLNRSSIIFAGNDKWSVDPRVSIVSSVGDKHEYSLQITKVDVTDDGLYTCSIQSERSPRPKLLNLIVKGECPSQYADRDRETRGTFQMLRHDARCVAFAAFNIWRPLSGTVSFQT